jgi:hypothetical protein
MNYFPNLALNCKSHDLILPSSLDYRCEPLAPSWFKLLDELGYGLLVEHLPSMCETVGLITDTTLKKNL